MAVSLAIAAAIAAGSGVTTKALSATSDERPVEGVVVTLGGTPISGVKVYGSTGISVTRELTKTDDAGHFRLDHPGAVLHFDAAAFEPQVLMTPKAGEVRVTLAPATEDRKFNVCERTPRHVQQVGWWKYGIHFNVNRREAVVNMGKVDADYVVDTVRPKGGNAVLELWFGLQAVSRDPMDEDVLRSVKVTQHRIFDGWGMDTRGETADGRLWRSAGLEGFGGGVYRNASQADAKVLDRVIDSMCWVNFPGEK